jgi:hypothetical protein
MQISVRASQETHYVSTTKPNRLMLFREIIAVYCENHMEHTNTLCGQNAEIITIKTFGSYRYHCALEFEGVGWYFQFRASNFVLTGKQTTGC